MLPMARSIYESQVRYMLATGGYAKNLGDLDISFDNSPVTITSTGSQLAYNNMDIKIFVTADRQKILIIVDAPPAQNVAYNPPSEPFGIRIGDKGFGVLDGNHELILAAARSDNPAIVCHFNFVIAERVCRQIRGNAPGGDVWMPLGGGTAHGYAGL